MVKAMKLKGQIRLNKDDGTVSFLGKLIDGTQFECKVCMHDYEQNEYFAPRKYTVDGWLYVVQEAQQHNRCYLTLPKPSIQHGKQILVDELQLQPRGIKISDFKPKKLAKSDKPTSVVMVEEQLAAKLAVKESEEKKPKKSSKKKASKE